MMQLSLGDLFTLQLLLFVLLIAYAWYRDERKHPSNDWTITKDSFYTCPRCHHSFLKNLKDEEENYMRCPRCQEPCFLKKKKRF